AVRGTVGLAGAGVSRRGGRTPAGAAPQGAGAESRSEGMRKIIVLSVLAVWAAVGACNDIPPDSVLRAEITPEELNAPPDYHRMKGALLNDVRIWRRLE